MITLDELVAIYKSPAPELVADGKTPAGESLQRLADQWEGTVDGEGRHLQRGNRGLFVTDAMLRIDQTVFLRRPRILILNCNIYGPDPDHLWFVVCDPYGGPQPDVRIESCFFESDVTREREAQAGVTNGLGRNIFPGKTWELAGWIIYGGIVAVKV